MGKPSSRQGRSANAASSCLAGLVFRYCSPRRMFAAITATVIVSNAIVVFARAEGSVIEYCVHHLLDSVLLVSLIFPSLVLFIFRPVKLHLAHLSRVEEDLAAERNKLRDILNCMPDGACIMDQSCRIEYANMALVKEFGAPQGRRCYEYFNDFPEICPDCRMAEVFAGNSFTREAQYKRKVYEVFETRLQNGDDTLSRLAIVRNITARKVAEDELRASREKLRLLSVHQQRAREEERAAVSRDIHDELGQVLATVQLGVSSLGVECQDPRQRMEKVEGMEQLVARAIRAVQRISTDLRPAILDELGLPAAIEWQAAEFRTRTGIACTPDILLQDTHYSKDLATALFRIFQETLTNVMRHSGATRVSVSLEERHGRIVLILADNGRGISPDQLCGKPSLGIAGMRERARSLGGRVRLFPSRQGGTVVIARIPVNASGGAI